MKRLVVGLAVASAGVMPSPALADDVGAAVRATVKEAYCRGLDPSGCNPDITANAINGLTWAIANKANNCWNSSDGWMKAAQCLLTFPRTWARQPTNGGGGGGSSWELDDPCRDLTVFFDPAGNLVLPTYRLPGGAPLVPNQNGVAPTAAFPQGPGYGLETGQYVQAKTGPSVILWQYHLDNARWDKAKWAGPVVSYKLSGSTYYEGCAPAYYKDGVLQAARCPTTPSYSFVSWYINGYNSQKPCPEAETTGGEFDFYSSGPAPTSVGQRCTFYHPRTSISPSGYYYPTHGALTNWRTWPRGKSGADGACPLTKKIIADLANALLDKAVAGGQLPSHPEVTEEDVRGGNNWPTVDDIGDVPTSGTDQPATTPPPDASPTPTPTPSSGVDLGPDPGVGAPTLEEAPTGLMDPIFDWLPDLPSINVNVGGAPCPTWEMQPYPGPEWHLVLDSHCDLLESNRAALGALMLVLFSIGAALIILRA